MKKRVTKFDFNKPEDAKTFLSRLWCDNRPVTGVQVPSGWIDFCTMTNDQLTEYASQLAESWMGKGSKLVYREPELQ